MYTFEFGNGLLINNFSIVSRLVPQIIYRDLFSLLCGILYDLFNLVLHLLLNNMIQVL